MKTNIRVLKLAVAAVLATVSAVFADPVPDRTPRDQPVTVGKWHSDLEKARAYAEANGLPLMAVWSNARFCSHCKNFENAIDSAVFKNWMKDSGMVFYFGCVYDGSYNGDGPIGPSADGKEGYHGTSFYWCRKKVGASDPYAGKSWPYVRIYWPKGGVDEMRSGSEVDGEGIVYGFPCGATDQMLDQNPGRWPFVEKGDYKTYNPAGRFAVDYLTNKNHGLLRNFDAKPAYAGGEFGVLDSQTYPNGGMQIEKGTSLTSFVIPFIRSDADVQALAATNLYMVTFPDGTSTGIKSFEWKAGEAYKELRVEFAASNLVGSARSDIEVLLGSDRGDNITKCHIAVVDPVANSPKNPKWIGESPIAPGVWTMDYAGAVTEVRAFNANETNKAEGKKAYTLLLFGGSLWCPDCSNNERYITDSAEFKAWATNAANPIACVAVDLPYENDSGAPSLLSWKTAQTDKGKQYFEGITGAGYLTRHGVPLTGNNGINAETTLARNIGATLKDTVNGGFCKPGTTGFYKPTYVLMREDGSVIGRIAHFGYNSSMLNTDSARYVVKRLREMIAQDNYEYVNDREERNDHPSSLKDDADAVLVARNKTGLNGTLSFTDAVDYYRINANAGTEITLDLDVKAETTLLMEVVDFANGTLTAVAGAVTNSASASKTLQCTLPSSTCFVKLSYPVDVNTFAADPYFAFTNANSTVCGYTLKSDSVYSAAQTESIEEILDGILEVVIKLRHDVQYKFTGLDTTSELVKAALEYDSESDTYTLSTNVTAGAVRLAVEQPESGNPVFGFQEWAPGSVGFLQDKGRVTEKGNASESDFVYEFQLQRSPQAVSGDAKVEVRFNDVESVYIDDPQNGGMTFVFEAFTNNIAGTVTNVWKEGESDVRTLAVTIKGNKLADGVQTLVFDLVKLDGCASNPEAKNGDVIGKFTLTVIDDDEALPGVIALAGVNGAEIPANRTVVAKGGSVLALTLSRKENSDGVLSGELLTNGVPAAAYNWGGRESADKTVEVTLPGYAVGADNRVFIAVAGLNGAQVEAENKYLTVKIVPENAAEFATDAVAVEMVRYVRPTDLEVAIDENTLADKTGEGVEVVKISGSLAPGLSWAYDRTAKKLAVSGTPTAAGEYVAVFQVKENALPGGTVQVEMSVKDPVAEAVAGSGVGAWLASARTFADNMVVATNDVKRLAGLLTVTVVRSGRLSAKYRSVEGETVSLMTSGWSSYSDGTYKAQLAVVSSDGGDYSLNVSANSDGTVEMEFFNGAEELYCIVQDDVWSSGNPADKWEGYYTVSVPKKTTLSGTVLAAGDGYLTLKMQGDTAVNSGRMTYAGLLPNGKAVSGAATVTRGESTSVVLPVVSVGGSDTLAGVLQVGTWSADSPYARVIEPYAGVYPYWKHVESSIGASYEVEMDVYGCRYTGEEDLVACCENAFGDAFGGTNLTFYAMFDKMGDGYGCRSGAASYTNEVPVNVTLDNLSLGASGSGVALYFNRSTGIVYGTAAVEFDGGKTATALFKGVILPGWGAASCSTCSEGTTLRPFVSGSCYLSDVFEYTDKAGRNRTLSVKRSCPFSVGSVAGM